MSIFGHESSKAFWLHSATAKTFRDWSVFHGRGTSRCFSLFVYSHSVASSNVIYREEGSRMRPTKVLFWSFPKWWIVSTNSLDEWHGPKKRHFVLDTLLSKPFKKILKDTERKSLKQVPVQLNSLIWPFITIMVRIKNCGNFMFRKSLYENGKERLGNVRHQKDVGNFSKSLARSQVPGR